MKEKQNIFITIIFSLLLLACDKEEIMTYEENSGVNFNNSVWTQQLMKGAVYDTVQLPLSITGTVRDYDRIVKVEAVLDSNTTATPELYVLQEGIVKAGKYYGNIPVVLVNNKILADSILQLKIKLVKTDDFSEVDLGFNSCTISFTTKVVRPANWNRWLRWYFGLPFSTRWWNFIQEATGRSSFPYDPLGDPEIYWMSAGELTAYAQIVKMALYEYNNDPKNGGPLTHDDGDYAGTEVKM